MAKCKGWVIIAVGPGDGRIKATYGILPYGSEDDVVVRVSLRMAAPEWMRVLTRVSGI